MKTKKIILFMLLVAIVSGTRVMAANEEAYAVYTSANSTITFYYDDQKNGREGDKYSLNTGDNTPGWIDDGKQFEKVVFAKSFASYRPTTTKKWFSGQTELTSITNIKYLKTDNVTTMSMMFHQCSKLTELDVSGFNTKNVKDMGEMFSLCHSLESLNVSKWNTSNVKNMHFTFNGCWALASLDVSQWDTSNVENMAYMFYRCSDLTSLDVSKWNTSKVKYLSNMFSESGLTSLDMSGWDTSNVENMSYMFCRCSDLTSLDVSGWNTGKVTNMNNMFNSCSGLTSLDVSGWNTSKVTDMGQMFNGCHGLTSLDLGGWDTSNVTDMGLMFYICFGLTSLDLRDWDTSKVENTRRMFDGCTRLTSLDLSRWDLSSVSNMTEMFDYCTGLVYLDLSGWDTSNVLYMDNMFYNCSSLTTIYGGAGWNTENATNKANMFVDCNNLRGSSGTAYDPNHTDGTYAHIDGGLDNPGYFSVREYSLWVGGTEVTSVNYESLPVMSGSASYDIPNKTLTLTNAIINVNAQGGYCIANGLSAEQRVQGIDGLKIEVIGQCQLNGSDIALMINGNTTLTGTGRLSLNGTTPIWIEEGKGLTVAVKDFHATATQEVIYGDYGSLTVDGTKINSFVCEPKTPNWRYITIRGVFMTMNDCHFADPEGPWSSGDVEEFNYWDGYYMRYGTKQYCGKVVIEPDSKPVNYRLWVGGIRVTSANKNNIGVASGTASYDPTTHTLTLNNAVIEADGYDDGISNGLANLEGMSDFKIVCKGTNNIVDAFDSDGYGLALYGNTTISGSRLGITAYDKGIYTGNGISLTLQNADVYTSAIYPIYSNYGVINVNHSRLEADPGSSQNSPVCEASEFNLNDCAFADPDIGIDPQHLYYNNDEQILKMYYLGGPYDGPILIVPTQVSISTNINEAGAPSTTDQPMYNLSGQRVGKDYKGIVIHNGKKVVR
ncbi:MAG: BspA family leucine-rich repeat surface protein [Prevotella sp.]|nr:BspA family leucine-rich repeat surface protein [Bacteroidales bacterium]MBR4363897.1 BspA family leucine-rich repeat surface protein [Prevotella sp.]MBR6884514.1 BspA family leucine-rich repeat surface protein [Prevotella sp.]